MLEDGEEEETEQGKEGIILHESRVFVREIQLKHERLRQGAAAGGKREDAVDIMTWDVASKYPWFKTA